MRPDRATSALHCRDMPTVLHRMEADMPESVYKVIELVGTSTESWEKAAKVAVDRAAMSLRDLRVAEVIEQDMVLDNGKVQAYRAKVKVSFKYEGKD
jgi:flavin-binding protein dodecin